VDYFRACRVKVSLKKGNRKGVRAMDVTCDFKTTSESQMIMFTRNTRKYNFAQISYPSVFLIIEVSPQYSICILYANTTYMYKISNKPSFIFKI
jgi:hypothetical protein